VLFEESQGGNLHPVRGKVNSKTRTTDRFGGRETGGMTALNLWLLRGGISAGNSNLLGRGKHRFGETFPADEKMKDVTSAHNKMGIYKEL